MLQLTRIAIYPGAFDPVHEGHLNFARKALWDCELDRVYFLPEPRPRHKQGVKALEHRIEMVQRAVAQIPEFGVIALQQARSNTIDTLPQIIARFGGVQLFLLSGERILRHLPYWLPIDAELRLSRVIVGTHKMPVEQLRQQFELLKETSGLQLAMERFESPKVKVHSLTVRRALRRGEMPSVIPTAVARYIKAQGLYVPESGNDDNVSGLVSK